MKCSTNECQSLEGLEEVLYIDAIDLAQRLASLIRKGKVADWMEIYMKPQTLVIQNVEQLDGLSDTFIEIMRLVKKRSACGHKTVIIREKMR